MSGEGRYPPPESEIRSDLKPVLPVAVYLAFAASALSDRHFVRYVDCRSVACQSRCNETFVAAELLWIEEWHTLDDLSDDAVSI